MNPIFDTIKSIYEKTILPEFKYDIQTCLSVSKWIGFDVSNIEKIKNTLSYLFYIEPQHYIFLLYLTLPKKLVPYLKNPDIKKQKENLLYKKIQNIFDWSDRDLKFHQSLLDRVIDKKLWSIELGI